MKYILWESPSMITIFNLLIHPNDQKPVFCLFMFSIYFFADVSLYVPVPPSNKDTNLAERDLLTFLTVQH